jgi:hypothetical protein
MIVGVEFRETPPTELIFAFSALHEFAATNAHNGYFAGRTQLRKHYFVEV